MLAGMADLLERGALLTLLGEPGRAARHLVERKFPDGLSIPQTAAGAPLCAAWYRFANVTMRIRCHSTLALLLLVTVGPARAVEPAPSSGSMAFLPTSGMLGFERLRLPNGEHLGLVSGAILFDIGHDSAVGPAVYAAATGSRGGFLAGGVEVQRRWPLRPGLSLATGLFAGGGGGAATPVGNGLMLRPALTVLKDLGPSLQAGLSYSLVRFPSGEISSHQVGLMLAWRNQFDYSVSPSGSSISLPTRATGLGFDRVSATASRYRFTHGSGRRVDLAGAQAERRSDIDGLTWGLEAAAAAKGGASGYAELLGTGEYSVAVLRNAVPSWRAGVRLGVGVAGGGGVPTGGGLLGKAMLTTESRIAPAWTVGAEYGVVRSRTGNFRATAARVWLGFDLEPGLDDRSPNYGRVVRTEWIASLQHHFHVQRRDGSRLALDTIGLELDRYLDEHLYLSGQVHSAFAGGAAPYSVGLVGVGIANSADAAWRVGGELLLGAAGGGGVQTAGGAIAQTMLWSAWKPSKQSEWRAGLGVSRGLNGATRASPIVELSWSRAFGMAGR